MDLSPAPSPSKKRDRVCHAHTTTSNLKRAAVVTIHATGNASLGPLHPGQTAEALNRIYFTESSLEAWHKRMKADLS